MLKTRAHFYTIPITIRNRINFSTFRTNPGAGKRGFDPSNPLTLETKNVDKKDENSWLSSASLGLECFKGFLRNNVTVISMW